ncbi:hypothetical protein Zmor_021861 [Zophobas morio]|uniref:Reverse transcriptase domain-containing protein n=1 Tax=Zophobas morio TaxID=2755281 RepID=A0AA38I8X3_9CUCU|nr:hypothetical protein Zmor_021861 [Zophobas morio]
MICPPDYNIHRNDIVHKRGGGVTIFLNKNCFSHFQIKTIDIEINSVETLALHICLQSFSLLLLCIYRPPDTPATTDNNIITVLTELITQYSQVIVTGDFNLPDFKHIVSLDHPNSTEALYHNFLIDLGLTQLVNEPTRFRENTNPSLLDWIIVNDRQLLSNIQHEPPIGISDHAVLSSQIQFFVSTHPNRVDSTVVKRINYNLVNSNINQIDWHSCLRNLDPNEQWNYLTAIITSLKAKYTKTMVIKRAKNKPWINRNLIKELSKKKALWKKFRRIKCNNDYVAHRLFSNELSIKLQKAKKAYEQSVIFSNNQKKFHQYIRNALCSKVSVPLIQHPNGTLCNNNLEVAELLAESFCKSFTPEPNDPLTAVLSTPSCENFLSNINFTPSIIRQEIKNLKSNSAPGPDSIDVHLLKHCISSLNSPLAIIMTNSFKTSIVPDVWRCAYVTPIFKKGNKLSPDNYRPISLVSVVSKIMESIIVYSLSQFLVENEIIPNVQHGFLKGRSIVTNLLSCLNEWSDSLDKHKPTDVIYLDFSRAFDCVPHQRLMHKLHHQGVRGDLLTWISSFLNNRSFKVRVDKEYSNPRSVLSGIPQGCVLVPLLFLAYTSDLVAGISSKCALYADDAKIFADPTSNWDTLQSDLYKIAIWSSAWFLPLNEDKCVVLHIGPNNPLNTYSINGKLLRSVKSVNDLGVIINDRLTWTQHIDKICKKANSTI